VEIVSDVRCLSDHDRNHAAAALSALAAAPSPPVPSFTETSTTQLLYPSSETEGNLPIISPAIPDGNETYEWDEGGDEKELGTDAMGAASTRDYKPGFFGNPCLLQYLRQVAHQRYHLWKASKRPYHPPQMSHLQKQRRLYHVLADLNRPGSQSTTSTPWYCLRDEPQTI
jgi:hypothetical protein